MKRRFVIFRSFRAKIAIILIALMLFSGAIGNYLIYEYSLRSQFDNLRNRLMIIAHAVALTLDAGDVLGIPLNRAGADSPHYRKVSETLLTVRKLVPDIAYIYILRKTEDAAGGFKFAIDIHPEDDKTTIPPAVPGQAYDSSRFPEMIKAFDGPSADKKIVADEWGAFLSGYSPVRDAAGNAIAVLGIDISAKSVYNAQKEVRKRALFVLLVGIVLALILSALVSGGVTSPIKELVEGARHISAGNLQYQVKVKGTNEINELAKAFNQMARNLYEARQNLLNYFYRAVQSLVRILEARDPYTKGHSDRVAEYSEKIARAMGMPPDKVELLKDAALLHDIGKMGIQEMILNKRSALSVEDRMMIEKHPAIGEEILKPVSLDKEMLAAIRGHHERYDGKGYPDRLKGDSIDIFAAIVAVADAYDAMTSHRGYRIDLDKNTALEQIKNNSGTQFNPGVVDAFLKVMRMVVLVAGQITVLGFYGF